MTKIVLSFGHIVFLSMEYFFFLLGWSAKSDASGPGLHLRNPGRVKEVSSDLRGIRSQGEIHDIEVQRRLYVCMHNAHCACIGILCLLIITLLVEISFL